MKMKLPYNCQSAPQLIIEGLFGESNKININQTGGKGEMIFLALKISKKKGHVTNECIYN